MQKEKGHALMMSALASMLTTATETSAGPLRLTLIGNMVMFLEMLGKLEINEDDLSQVIQQFHLLQNRNTIPELTSHFHATFSILLNDFETLQQ